MTRFILPVFLLVFLTVQAKVVDHFAAKKFESAKHAFLDVQIDVEPVDDFCGAQTCDSVSYGISLLSTQNQFDLQSLMLQDGALRRMPLDDRLHFEDSTVVRIAEEYFAQKSKMFIGIRVFDMPDDIQDYIIVDVTNVIGKDRKARVNFVTETARISVKVAKKTEDQLFREYSRLKHLEHEIVQAVNQENQSQANGCACSHRNCACCEFVKIQKLRLHDSVCVNVTYISADIGVRFSLSVDNHVYYSKELSIRNPPPVCYDVPHLREYASLCIQLYNMQLADKHLDGCVEMEANLYHLKVAKKRLGCFRIPI